MSEFDMEKYPVKPSDDAVASSSVADVEIVTESTSGWSAFKDSFKPAVFHDIDTSKMTNEEIAAMATATSPLSRSLKPRHLQMIAVGGCIGTGLFVGTGASLSHGGPAAMLIAFALIGSMLFTTVHALGELAVSFPVSGSFSAFSTRFIDPAWGFAMGWNYGLQWLVVFPLELVGCSITVGFWDHEAKYNSASWVAIFYCIILILNIFGAKGYGEAESFFSIVKVLAVSGFCILGIVIAVGGAPNSTGYIGTHYWYNPGAFAQGFKGVCAVLVNAAFAFSGTELIGLAASETPNPAKALPRATKQVFWRVLLFYILPLTIMGCIIPYNDPHLLGHSSTGASTSPFVLAISNAGISGLPSVMNVVVMLALLSVANAAIYGCSRTLMSLALQGQAPKILGYVDRAGRPLVAMGLTFFVGLICFVAASDKQTLVFTWLLAISGLSTIFTWGSICLCHIRFRRGMKVQGRSTDELVVKSMFGVLGSWYGLILNVLVLCFTFWTSLYPIDGSKPNATVFFQNYLAAPVIIVFYVFYKVWRRPAVVRAKSMDLVTGRRMMDIEATLEEIRQEKAYIASRGMAYRIFRFWC
ncbi:general amino acid permease AGP1 [Nadsonia fulvescens var. elongata DSM 6958]|uniref:General amino acid permease AGP1 n=1 Tax=Nadsonia fulvescens var. elongata DSM 6958 TaxID=857566 RepID=A0A1E3PNI7_9ASCO|nr:general amino acid permease AGP1 [Nadsonia fulvescens var. elongata DSM 6958]